MIDKMRKIQCSQVIGAVYVSDSDALKKKLSKLKFDGLNHLHILTDFDQTLTRQYFSVEN